MKKASQTLLSLLFVSMCSLTANAQDTTYSSLGYVEDAYRIGGFVGYARNYHSTTSDIYFNCPECGQYTDGQGSGLALSIFGELPLAKYIDKLALPFGDARFDAYLGMGLSERGGDFGEAVTAVLPVQDPNTLEYVPLRRQHGYNASMRYLNFDLGLRVMPYPVVPVYVNLGLTLNTPMGDATEYEQSERILAPNGVLYPETNRQDKIAGKGVITGINSPLGLRGGIGYPVPLSEVLSAAPEVRYTIPLGDAVDNRSWSIASLDVGVAVRYRFPGDEPQPKPVPPPKREPLAIKVPKPAPQVVVTTESVDAGGGMRTFVLVRAQRSFVSRG